MMSHPLFSKMTVAVLLAASAAHGDANAGQDTRSSPTTSVIALSGEVPPPPAPPGDSGIPGIRAQVASLALEEGLRVSLDTKLRNAQSDLESGELAAACGLLGAFGNQVAAHSGGKIAADAAHDLLERTATAESSLGCP